VAAKRFYARSWKSLKMGAVFSDLWVDVLRTFIEPAVALLVGGKVALPRANV
jgi:hypothetical protein